MCICRYVEALLAVVACLACMPSIEADRFGGSRLTWMRRKLSTQLHPARLHTTHRRTAATPVHLERYGNQD
ncbi:hypothetical protein LY76DRAFT_596030 [Colletotrichum caudatum]|nr:hypothetical protein LY76DRAFT_596030 [Colletotrichum caudatum]